MLRHTPLLIFLDDYFIPPRLESDYQTIRTYRRQVYGTWKTKEF
jgi:hypothetical protein